MVETTMDVSGWLRKQLEEASPDLLRAIVKDFAQALIGAEADALCGRLRGALAGAGHASVSTRRVEKLVQQHGVERMSKSPGLEVGEEPRPEHLRPGTNGSRETRVTDRL